MTQVARERWGWPELFIAIQLLWGAVLFLPGAQGYRVYIRALPYVLSGAALVYYFRRATGEPIPTSAKWLFACFALLTLNLLQSTTHLVAGVGQIVFQICIAAPAFWMVRAVRNEARLETLVWVLFGSSLLGSTVGILQVYLPAVFLPPEFNTLAQALNPDIVSSLTYVGADGRAIIRPPGLSDSPGGASVAGMMSVILGLTLAVQRQRTWPVTAICLAGGAVGMTVLFLTHVRALSLLAAASVGVSALLRVRQGRAGEGAFGVVAGIGLLAGAYVWAVSVGGDAVADRFLGLVDEGVLHTFDESRGSFLRYTLAELLYEFPLGAGLGRWGMMQVLFGDSTMWQAPPIHVEVQPTGWLLDGGLPLLVLYAGALATALHYTYRMAVSASSVSVQDVATVLLCVQLAIVTLCLTGAVFNTQLGIQFWAVTGALAGATRFLRA
ncbi:MAG TPA: hypothetical protein VFO58_10230 [Vicinamibacterales bacterium]|nr:hypothetical protein [Vicinamibacterales bacterium]